MARCQRNFVRATAWVAGVGLMISEYVMGDDNTTGTSSCLCVFDIDRTLTGRQGATSICSTNLLLEGVEDTAYGGGKLTLSEIGQTLEGTFCAENGCFVGLVSTGDGGGRGSDERKELERRLAASGARNSSTVALAAGAESDGEEFWSGPSKLKDLRSFCPEGMNITSPYVVGCNEGSKQNAVAAIVDLLESTENVSINASDVYFFDDKADNVRSFEGTGFNAIQISCPSRDGDMGNAVGLCGGFHSELVEGIVGVKPCSVPDEDEEEPPAADINPEDSQHTNDGLAKRITCVGLHLVMALLMEVSQPGMAFQTCLL